MICTDILPLITIDLYEQAIRTIKCQKHNSRSIEPTYVEREAIKEFIQCYELQHGSLYDIISEKYPVRFDLEQDLAQPLHLNERSYQASEKLLTALYLKSLGDRHAKRLIDGGVLKGMLTKKFLSDTQYQDIKQILKDIHGQHIKIPLKGRFCDSLVKYNSNGIIQKFSKGTSAL